MLLREHSSTRVWGSDSQKKTQNSNTDTLDFCGTVQTCDVPRIKIKCYQTNLSGSIFYLEIFSVTNGVLYSEESHFNFCISIKNSIQTKWFLKSEIIFDNILRFPGTIVFSTQLLTVTVTSRLKQLIPTCAFNYISALHILSLEDSCSV